LLRRYAVRCLQLAERASEKDKVISMESTLDREPRCSCRDTLSARELFSDRAADAVDLSPPELGLVLLRQKSAAAACGRPLPLRERQLQRRNRKEGVRGQIPLTHSNLL